MTESMAHRPKRKTRKTQTEKYHLAMAGEYYVAAELHRFGVQAAVTYGNAKSADVVAFSARERSVVVEVKSTSEPEWVVGSRVPARWNLPWVFVHIPRIPEDHPTFYVMLQSELRALLVPTAVKYIRGLRERGRKPGGYVWNLKRKDAEMANTEGRWDKILEQLKNGNREAPRRER